MLSLSDIQEINNSTDRHWQKNCVTNILEIKIYSYSTLTNIFCILIQCFILTHFLSPFVIVLQSKPESPSSEHLIYIIATLS
jgi:hypothetical protein